MDRSTCDGTPSRTARKGSGLRKRPDPPSDILYGPRATHNWDIWTAQSNALLKKYDIGDHSLFGGLKGNDSVAKNIENLWEDWFTGAEVESRATFGVSSPNRPGAPFDIKQGSLQQALASREAMYMQKPQSLPMGSQKVPRSVCPPWEKQHSLPSAEVHQDQVETIC